ncbi:MAG: flagellar assembly protein FliW [candidate division Zixibacteria bacterium]|nr:flagellar assembly protein FliW [candidate division Zixibacteria bacterium]
MLIDSFRLGQLEVPDDRIITMKRPILGFENLSRFCLVESKEMAPFLWLHSVEDPSVVFIVVNPIAFFPDYQIEVNPKEIAELEIERLEAVETYVIATVPEDPDRISVNLQGPVLINTENGLAKQLILVNSNYRVNHSVMDAIEAIADKSIEKEEEPAGV